MAPEVALQQWAYDTLTAAAMTATGHTGTVPVRDWVPDATEFPYVSIGEDVLTEDVYKGSGRDFSLTVHVWSRYAGKLQAKEIGGAVVTALLAAITTTGEWRVTRVNLDAVNYFLDPDGRTTHGVVRVEGHLANYPD
jgi:hypothetical protein